MLCSQLLQIFLCVYNFGADLLQHVTVPGAVTKSIFLIILRINAYNIKINIYNFYSCDYYYYYYYYYIVCTEQPLHAIALVAVTKSK